MFRVEGEGDPSEIGFAVAKIYNALKVIVLDSGQQGQGDEEQPPLPTTSDSSYSKPFFSKYHPYAVWTMDNRLILL